MTKTAKPILAAEGQRDPEADPVLAELQAANPGVKMFALDGYRFDHEGHTQECVLPPLHRFVVVCGGQANKMLSDVAPGTYVFVAPPPPEGGGWPQMVMVVKFEHIEGWLNMSGDQTAELIAMIEGQTEAH